MCMMFAYNFSKLVFRYRRPAHNRSMLVSYLKTKERKKKTFNLNKIQHTHAQCEEIAMFVIGVPVRHTVHVVHHIPICIYNLNRKRRFDIDLCIIRY